MTVLDEPVCRLRPFQAELQPLATVTSLPLASRIGQAGGPREEGAAAR